MKQLSRCILKILRINYVVEMIIIFAAVLCGLYWNLRQNSIKTILDLNPQTIIYGKNSLIKTSTILCLCLTHKQNQKYAQSVLDTWGGKCTKLLFISEKMEIRAEFIPLNITKEGRSVLWEKVRQTFLYVSQHYINDFDWFVKADDDTYLVMENLNYFLSKYNPNLPYYFGKYFQTLGNYNSGGAGYVLSRETVRLLGHIINKSPSCNKSNGPEDYMMGRCLSKGANIHPSPAIDIKEYELFRCFSLPYISNRVQSNKRYWIHNYNFYKYRVGFDCCSPFTISFHYMKPQDKYNLHFLLYYIKVHHNVTAEYFIH